MAAWFHHLYAKLTLSLPKISPAAWPDAHTVLHEKQSSNSHNSKCNWPKFWTTVFTCNVLHKITIIMRSGHTVPWVLGHLQCQAHHQIQDHQELRFAQGFLGDQWGPELLARESEFFNVAKCNVGKVTSRQCLSAVNRQRPLLAVTWSHAHGTSAQHISCHSPSLADHCRSFACW